MILRTASISYLIMTLRQTGTRYLLLHNVFVLQCVYMEGGLVQYISVCNALSLNVLFMLQTVKFVRRNAWHYIKFLYLDCYQKSYTLH